MVPLASVIHSVLLTILSFFWFLIRFLSQVFWFPRIDTVMSNPKKFKMLPLVKSVPCNCKVDSALKTIVGVGKLVPRSMQGDTEPNAEYPLLPGLLDDLAIACLIRVPLNELMKLRSVCKRWYRLLSDSLFYSLRKNNGVAEEWVYVIKNVYSNGRNSLHTFDPIYKRWLTLAPIPWEFSSATDFGCQVIGGCHLYLFGGFDDKYQPMKKSIFYCAATNQWNRVEDMMFECIDSKMSSCVLDNRLYIAGCKMDNQQQRFAQIYDPSQGNWNSIPEISTSMHPSFGGFVDKGTWFLKGVGSDYSDMWEAYTPETADNWIPITDAIVKGWCDGPTISLNENLYALGSWGNRWRLNIYNRETDSWEECVDCTQDGVNSVVALVLLNGELCIYHNMGFTLIDVAEAPYIREYIVGENIMIDDWEGQIISCQVLKI